MAFRSSLNDSVNFVKKWEKRNNSTLVSSVMHEKPYMPCGWKQWILIAIKNRVTRINFLCHHGLGKRIRGSAFEGSKPPLLNIPLNKTELHHGVKGKEAKKKSSFEHDCDSLIGAGTTDASKTRDDSEHECNSLMGAGTNDARNTECNCDSPVGARTTDTRKDDDIGAGIANIRSLPIIEGKRLTRSELNGRNYIKTTLLISTARIGSPSGRTQKVLNDVCSNISLIDYDLVKECYPDMTIHDDMLVKVNGIGRTRTLGHCKIPI